MKAALHHRSNELCNGRNAHQDDSHEGQDHVDTFPQEHFGINGFGLLCLLFLLMELQFGNPGLA